MKRGDLVTVALPGDFGKPRPALVIQPDQFAATGTVTVLLITATLIDAPLLRVSIEPSPTYNLRDRSQVMIDKAMSVRRVKLGEPFGRLHDEQLLSIGRLLALFLGFA